MVCQLPKQTTQVRARKETLQLSPIPSWKEDWVGHISCLRVGAAGFHASPLLLYKGVGGCEGFKGLHRQALFYIHS
jgi:hypothetical protein